MADSDQLTLDILPPRPARLVAMRPRRRHGDYSHLADLARQVRERAIAAQHSDDITGIPTVGGDPREQTSD